MSKAFKDFDSFFAEKKDESSLKLKIYDKEYTLPSSVPASIMLEIYRLIKAGKSEIGEEKQLEMAIALLGEANVEEWCKNGLTTDQLAEIMMWAIDQMYSKTQKSMPGKAPVKRKKR